MKQITLLALILIGLNSFSQEKGTIGLSLAIGQSEITPFVPLIGAGSSTGQGFYSLSLSYVKPINSWLNLQTGLDFGYHKFMYRSATMPDQQFDPVSENALVISVPLGFRAYFLKYFYFNTGALLDIDFSNNQYIHNQTGFGAQAGIGFHYQFKQRFGVYVNPILTIHSLVPFDFGNYHERIIESGVRFGISYGL
jgi:hypothetical protein